MALQKELHQLQQHILLVKHAAHQHGVEHTSKLGSMLYDDGIALPADNNSSDVDLISQQDDAHSEAADLELLSEAHAQESDSDTVKNASSRREMPHRTHHQTQQTLVSP